VRNHHIAHVLGASRLHAFSKPVVDLLNQIFLPVLRTKLMSTGQTIAFPRWWVKLGVTYAAETLVIRFKSSTGIWKFLWNRGVKLDADFVFEFVFLVKPVILELVIVPFEVFEYLYSFVRIALEQVCDFLNFFHLPLSYLFHLVHHKVILRKNKWGIREYLLLIERASSNHRWGQSPDHICLPRNLHLRAILHLLLRLFVSTFLINCYSF
jgi:hypothetical protein